MVLLRTFVLLKQPPFNCLIYRAPTESLADTFRLACMRAVRVEGASGRKCLRVRLSPIIGASGQRQIAEARCDRQISLHLQRRSQRLRLLMLLLVPEERASDIVNDVYLHIYRLHGCTSFSLFSRQRIAPGSFGTDSGDSAPITRRTRYSHGLFAHISSCTRPTI
jgi:hypothetical protein